jgi:lipid-A-disaccharide synthase
MPRIAIIAGEASGDRLGASLIRSARKLNPNLEFTGVAGPLMRAEGCDAWFDSQELAVMGLFEVLRHLPRLQKIKREVERRLLEDPPDVLVGIDAPDFNLRVEQVAHAAGIRTVHYVCPSVWAWRQSRVKILRKACDRVLCLLPFEADFLKQHGVSGTFVGHPLADEIAAGADRDAARVQLGIKADTVIALLPGSRLSEVTRLAPVFAATAALLNDRVPELSFVIPIADPSLRDSIQDAFARHAPGCRTKFLDGSMHAAVTASDVVLVASGTATLEVMLLNRAMVVAYRVSPATYWLARILRLIKVEFISLPNLLAGEKLVEEFIQNEANAEALSAAILNLLDSPDRRAALGASFAALHDRLRRSASDRAAAEVVAVIASEP